MLLIIFLIGCKPAHRNNEITKIELATLWGWGDFEQAVSINASLTYNYYGNGFNKKESLKRGYFKAHITERFWDILNSKFEEIKYKTLPDSGNNYIDDGSTFELIIHWKNKRKRIVGFYGLQNDSVRNALVWLNETYKNIPLTEIKRPFKFETTLQNPPPEPPIPANFRFLPPTKKELERNRKY